MHNMTAELSQAEKSPAAVLTQGGSNSLRGGDGDGDAAAVVVAVADERKKRQSLSDVFTIVGCHHCDEDLFVNFNEECILFYTITYELMLTLSWPIDCSRCCSHLRWIPE